MVPSQLAELYAALMAARFGFMPVGQHHLRDIHQAVRARYSHLCDDAVLCRDICTEGTDAPEWQHRVRAALQNLKSSGVSVRKGSERGYWIFDASTTSIGQEQPD